MLAAMIEAQVESPLTTQSCGRGRSGTSHASTSKESGAGRRAALGLLPGGPVWAGVVARAARLVTPARRAGPAPPLRFVFVFVGCAGDAGGSLGQRLRLGSCAAFAALPDACPLPDL